MMKLITAFALWLLGLVARWNDRQQARYVASLEKDAQRIGYTGGYKVNEFDDYLRAQDKAALTKSRWRELVAGVASEVDGKPMDWWTRRNIYHRLGVR